ncbi:MAG TPA: hypothetical protein VJR92_08305 [Gemmatimonadaceae bacterium]|nr:hypothetical protein [Gemmatimonadaceae bacterium]
MRQRVFLAASVAALWAAAAASARGQGQCQTNGAESCTTQSNNTNSVSLTITRATRLELSATNISLLNATAGAFDSTFATTSGLTLTVKSNQGWSVTTRVTTGSWVGTPLGGSGATPRANKPDADLLWAINPGGPFTPYSTTDVQLQASGGATAGTVIPLSFRVLYSWVLDTPGVYTIPIQFTITAP